MYRTPVAVAFAAYAGLAFCAAALASETRLTKIIANDHVPGAQIVVVRRGQLIFQRSFGVRDIKTGDPVDDHTRFEIGSITKQFTAAAILQLKERGKLSLGDPLSKYIPQYAEGRRVTIRQMLWHVSGLPDYTTTKLFGEMLTKRRLKSGTPRDLGLVGVLGMIRGIPLDFPPGSGMEYSNTNYNLLGYVVARVSGMPWQQYVRENLFRPAHMLESSFIDEEGQSGHMATGYIAPDVPRVTPAGPFINPGGAGAIVSTAGDLARWDGALFGGRIISRDDLAAMTAPGPRPIRNLMGYGFGWAIEHYGKFLRVSHNGATPGFGSSSHVYPELSEYVIVLTNAQYAHPGVIADVAFNQLNPGIAARENIDLPRAPLAVTVAAKALVRTMLGAPVNPKLFSKRMYKLVGTGKFLQQGYAYLGNPGRMFYRGKEPGPGTPIFKYRLLFDTGAAIKLNLKVTSGGKIDGLEFRIE